MSRKILALPLALLALTAMPAFAAPPAPAPLPAPKILVVDRVMILQYSKVGQDIARQIQAMTNQAKGDLAAQGRALQAEGQALSQQVAILAPDVKEKKIAAFDAKQAAFQGAAQKKEDSIQGGLLKARQTVEQAVGPILQQLMQERGANLVLDKNALVMGNGAFDVTAAVIDRLNQKLSSVKVTLAALPAGASAAH